ncbi:MAG: SIS domain-containing protein [Holophagaceae bacterium]|nr:SIS domain-containing protein [Holophagaceae bacterium]
MTSKMFQESASTPSVIAEQLLKDEERYSDIGKFLQKNRPSFIATIARGSSDHACNYGAYMIAAKTGVPAISLPPSLVTLYRAPLKMSNAMAIGVSQSGKSPDIVATMEACAKEGAKTIAFANIEDSPLAKLANTVFPLHAGPELSVAATKTFIASMVALARFVGHWNNEQALLDALKDLPEKLERAQKADLDTVANLLLKKNCALVLGRGPTWSIALEAALKLKETCSLQAEAFSSAEIKHGPKALIKNGYPIVMFAARGESQSDVLDTAKEMRDSGAEVCLIATENIQGANLVIPCPKDPWLDPIVMIQFFHLAVERLAQKLGMNPDAPPHLNKVTLTV